MKTDPELSEFEQKILKELAVDNAKRECSSKKFRQIFGAIIGICIIFGSTIFGFKEIADLGEAHREELRKLRESDPERYESHAEKRARIMYKGWCKETGNPKDLTLEEFKVLKLIRSSWDGSYSFRD